MTQEEKLEYLHIVFCTSKYNFVLYSIIIDNAILWLNKLSLEVPNANVLPILSNNNNNIVNYIDFFKLLYESAFLNLIRVFFDLVF